ncbi:hypothetical protein ABZX93_26980 [Streptomyces sp. NPDC006632]|uniref:hypothetical protein n=1 Tax=Streptomyces sp. NPDC006632 TaxID=3157182 RepID=UPI0033ADF99C
MADVADVDAITRELYGLRPDEFTAERDACAARARSAGESAVAKEIKALRKPTLVVWAANLLARSDADRTRRLLELGQALREAHRALAGEELRELSHQRHAVVAAMARQARELAEEAGQPVSEAVQHGVEEILHTVLADPETARTWAGGVLTKTPPPAVGFAGLEPAPGATAPAPTAKAAPAHKPRQADTKADTKANTKADTEAGKRAQAQADRTAQAYREADDELALAREAWALSRSRLDELDRQIAGLQGRLETARAERGHRATEADAAARRHQQADHRAKVTRTAAEQARAELDALQHPHGRR